MMNQSTDVARPRITDAGCWALVRRYTGSLAAQYTHCGLAARKGFHTCRHHAGREEAARAEDDRLGAPQRRHVEQLKKADAPRISRGDDPTHQGERPEMTYVHTLIDGRLRNVIREDAKQIGYDDSRRPFCPTTEATIWVETWEAAKAAGMEVCWNEDQTEIELRLPAPYKFSIQFQRKEGGQ
jgi:hypothetical protein